MAATTDPPRPRVWEVPELKNQASFFIKPLTLRNEISARLVTILTSNEIANDSIQLSRIENFLRNRIHFGRQQDWEAHRLLGRGSYGTVGLWVRRDDSNEIVDEVAVKDQTRALSSATAFSLYTEPGFSAVPGLLGEAVVHKQLNEYACENILHLRGYSFITDDDPSTDRPGHDNRRFDDNNSDTESTVSANADVYRMYTEFAPYQALDDLRDRYRNWQQYLPEPFLWHLFDSLAAAILVLEKGPQLKFSSNGRTRSSSKKWPEDWGVVHFDIKPGNIFLGYEKLKDETASVTGGSRILGYPVIKLSDYGLCKITGPGDPDNPSKLYWAGTKHYRPPEQDQYGAEWQNPPNGKARPTRSPSGRLYRTADVQAQEKSDPDPGWHFSSAANVWNVGKVMYDMATLSRSSILNNQIIYWCTTEPTYVSNGNHVLQEDTWNTIPFEYACENEETPQIPYSPALMELVRECLRPAINLRITADELRKATQAGLALAEHNLDPANINRRPPNRPARSSRSRQGRSPTLATPRLYCRSNEINDMPAGATNFLHLRNDYNLMMDRAWQDPDWPTLAPPRSIWGEQMDNIGQESVQFHDYTIINDQIRFRVPATGQASNGPDNPIVVDSSSDESDDGVTVISISSDEDEDEGSNHNQTQNPNPNSSPNQRGTPPVIYDIDEVERLRSSPHISSV